MPSFATNPTTAPARPLRTLAEGTRYNWVCHSRIPEMIAVAKSIKSHWNGLVAYLETRLTNGPAEAINGIIQTVKRKCRGFRNFLYFRTMIYLVASKLTFDLPSPVPIHPHQTT